MRNGKPTGSTSDAEERERGAVRIVIRGRFTPHTVVLRSGRPHLLVFRREETSPCSEQVVFPSIGCSVALPAFEDVVVEIPVLAPGSYAFTCGRAALHGRIVVRGETPGL